MPGPLKLMTISPRIVLPPRRIVSPAAEGPAREPLSTILLDALSAMGDAFGDEPGWVYPSIVKSPSIGGRLDFGLILRSPPRTLNAIVSTPLDAFAASIAARSEPG